MRRIALTLAFAFAFGAFAVPAQAQSNNVDLTVEREVNITAGGTASINIDPSSSLSGTATITGAYTVDAVSASTHNVTASVGTTPSGVTSVTVDGPGGSGDLTQGDVTVEDNIADVLGSSSDLTYTVSINTSFPADGTSDNITVTLTIN